jgi:hypothetical protein
VVRSDRVRQKCPVRAAYFRHVLPHVVGFPYLRVLCLIRHPRSMQRVVPMTRRLRLPGMGATAEPRFQHCSVSGFPLPCLRSCIPCCWGVLPPGAVGASQVLVRLSSCMPRPEDSGGPSHPCQKWMLLWSLRCALQPSASATSAFSKRSQPFRVRAHPCGLQASLSTLRPSCSPCFHGSAMDARLATGGWLALPRQGLSPCKRRQALLGAITLPVSGGPPMMTPEHAAKSLLGGPSALVAS